MNAGHRLGNLNGRTAKFRIIEKRMNAGFPYNVLCRKQKTKSKEKTTGEK
jgi:hypothetical protein